MCPVSGSMCRGLESGKTIPLSFQIVEGLDAENMNQQLDKYRDGKAIQKLHVHPLKNVR